MFDDSFRKPKSRSSKSYRTIKIKRKVKEYDNIVENNEDDYLLENGGDIKKFLRQDNQKFPCPRYDENGGIVAHSIIGPVSLFNNDLKEKDSQYQLKKVVTLNKKKRKETDIDPYIRYKQILEKISNINKTALQEERKKQQIISQRQKLIDSRQDQVMQSFQKTVKY